MFGDHFDTHGDSEKGDDAKNTFSHAEQFVDAAA